MKPSPRPLSSPLLAAAALALAGCTHLSYDARPVDTAATQARWQAARTDEPALRDALARQGVDVGRWPLPDWSLAALTGLALERHPELMVAHAELRSADAARDVARQRAGRGVETTLDHHSAPGATSSPWSLGVVLDLAVGGGARRDAQADEADALANEAVALAAQSAWQVSQRVRTSYRELFFATRRREQAEAALLTRQAVSQAQRARLARGAVDGREPLLAGQAEAEAVLQQAQARDAEDRAWLALAGAVGIPGDTLTSLPMRFEDLDADPPELSPAELQRLALLNRLDLRAALARHDAADAALRVELARQWPEIVLRPGYAWDQGDNRWSLGVALSLPPGGDNRAPIELARARCDVEAAKVAALQQAALARLEGVRQAARAALVQQELADAAARNARQQSTLAQRRLDAGEADRLEWLTARLGLQEAERRLVDARAARWSAAGELEDALQVPLEASTPMDRQAAAGPTRALSGIAPTRP